MPIVLNGFSSAASVETTDRSFNTLIDGDSKTGKTQMSLTWPRPLYHFNFDRDGWTAYQNVPEADRSSIMFKNYWVDIVTNKADQNVQSEAQSALQDFMSDYNSLIQQLKTTNESGTIFLDTQTTLYAMVRFADFGKLEKVRGREYGEVNTIMESIFQRAFHTNAHLVATARLKEKYENDRGTGTYVAKGFSDIKNCVQAEVRTFYNTAENSFCAQIMSNAFNPNANSAILPGELMNFTMLKATLGLGG